MISKAEGAYGDYDLNDTSLLALKAKKDRSIIPRLWNQIYKLVISTCNKYWNNHEEAKKRCEIDDLIQESYIQFEQAIQKYEPDRGAQFSTFLTFFIKRACIEATGGRTERQRNDPIFNCDSIDAPAFDNDETTIGELIPDENSSHDFDEAAENDTVRFIICEVKKIRGQTNQYFFLKYAYEGISKAELARKSKVSQTNVASHIHNAAYQLRMNAAIRSVYHQYYKHDYIPDYTHKGVDAFFNTGTSIVEDIVFRKLSIEQANENKERKKEKHHAN